MRFKHSGCGGHVDAAGGFCSCSGCGDVVNVKGETPYYPNQLKQLEQWICWRFQCGECECRTDIGVETCPECGAGSTKVPVNAETGSYASATRDYTWTDFETAVFSDVDVDGVGFVFTDSDDVVGVDLDHCRDPETGEIDDWAMEIVRDLRSFTEVSVSGTGIHVYCLGVLPDGGNVNGDVEMYDNDRFFAFTGDWLSGTPFTLEPRQSQIDSIHEEYISRDTGQGKSQTEYPGGGNQLSDTQVVKNAQSADDGGKFESLWSGETEGYDSHSEARMALLCKLAFWTGGDKKQMNRLYERSSLHPHPTKPGKWDRVRDKELKNAIRVQNEFYG